MGVFLLILLVVGMLWGLFSLVRNERVHNIRIRLLHEERDYIKRLYILDNRLGKSLKKWVIQGWKRTGGTLTNRLASGSESGRICVWLSYISGITLLGILAVYQISIDPITWDSAVAVFLLLVAVLPVLTIWSVKRHRKRTLFTLEYQTSLKVSAFSHEIEASIKEQRVQITLRLTLDTYAEYLAVLFNGEGVLPLVKGLDDWQWGKGAKPDYISSYPVPNDTEGRWFWHYESPHHRFRKTRITIGIDFLATDYFNGYLVIQFTGTDGIKEQKLPFNVKKHTE